MAVPSSDRLFRVTKRTLPTGSVMYYASFRTATGTWSPRKSTGKTTRGAAEKWCLERLQDGRAVSIVHGGTTLAAYVADFWGADGRYARQRKARGFELSRVYLENNRRSLDKHILPVFGSWKLYELTTAVLDAFFLELFEESGLRGSTINGIMRALTVPLADAERLGHIGRNPMRAVTPFATNARTRGALSQAELDALFSPDAVETVWSGDRQPMVLAMLCAGCGLRHGEAVAVRPMDVENGILRVTRQWDRGAGLFKSPKWNSVREVPIPPRLVAEIDRLVATRAIPAGGVLSAAERARIPHHPDNHLELVDALRAALVEIGIPETDQKRTARFLDVHSLRHTYITRLRAAGVPDWEIQSAAGHKSAVMTDAYTHGRGADYKSVAASTIIPFEKREAS